MTWFGPHTNLRLREQNTKWGSMRFRKYHKLFSPNPIEWQNITNWMFQSLSPRDLKAFACPCLSWDAADSKNWTATIKMSDFDVGRLQMKNKMTASRMLVFSLMLHEIPLEGFSYLSCNFCWTTWSQGTVLLKKSKAAWTSEYMVTSLSTTIRAVQAPGGIAKFGRCARRSNENLPIR